MPDVVAPADESERPSQVNAPGTIATTGARSSAALVAARAGDAMPLGGSAPNFNPTTARGTGTRSVPAFAGMPPGEHRTLLPVPSNGLSQVTDPAPDPSALAPETAAAEPVAAIKPLPDSGRIGLLALVAFVCVVGVGAGAIRAFVSQRASKTKAA